MISANYILYHFLSDREEFLSSHFHNEIELIFPVTDGTGMIVDNRVFPLRRGYLYILNEHTLHNRIELSPSYERYNMYFDPIMLTNFSTKKVNFKNKFTKYFYIINVQDKMDEFMQLFAGLMECQSRHETDDVTPTIYFLQLLKKMYDLIGEEARDEEQQRIEGGQQLDPKIFQIHSIQTYINAHLTEPLTLDFIAENFFLSKYYLSHMFKKMTGYGVMEYVRLCRINKACQMLRNGLPVTTVSENIGLKNIGRFNRVFKSYVGMTPKQYFAKYATVPYQPDPEAEDTVQS